MKIYYGDGAVYDNWDSSPDVGVQCVIVDVGLGFKEIIMGEDIYADPSGQSSRTKLGVWMPEAEYMALIEKALRS